MITTRDIHITKTTSTTSDSVYDQDKRDATELVDNLLQYTQSLMESTKTTASSSQDIHHIIAFSGGIDSSVVTALVHQVSSTYHPDSRPLVTAVQGLSPAVPSDQIRLAEEVAYQIGVTLEQIPTTEGNDEMYIANAGKACLACKTHLYTCLSSIADHFQNNQNQNNPHFQLYNGTNADDLKDPTRLGLIAADQFNVQSPLRHTPKHLVRVAGRHLGLPNWDYAASPCLRSRLALNVKALPEHLVRIEQAENFVRNILKLDPTRNMRVRLLSQNRAMVEVDDGVLDLAHVQIQNDIKIRDYFIHELGFASVGVRSFKTGSVAQMNTSSTISEQTTIRHEEVVA